MVTVSGGHHLINISAPLTKTLHPMESLPHESDISQPPSVESLYHDSLEWQLEVALWKQELKFFQRMLDINARHCHSSAQKKKLGHFQNIIIYYNGELLDQFRQQTRRNSKYLAQHVEDTSDFNYDGYQQKFRGLGERLQAFSVEYRKYKNEFFQFLEEVMEHSVDQPTV